MKIKFAKQWDNVSQLWKKFYPITITSAVADVDRGQRLNTTLADIISTLQTLTAYFVYDFYKDFYLGVGATASDVKIAANYHDEVRKSTKFPFTNASGKIWLIMPSEYTPTVEMNSLTVPMELDSTYTEDNVTYKVWKSTNTYSGSFNLFLL